jgi:hypothetical protein
MNVYSSIFGALEDTWWDKEPKGYSDNEVYRLSIWMWQLIPILETYPITLSYQTYRPTREGISFMYSKA